MKHPEIEKLEKITIITSIVVFITLIIVALSIYFR